MSNLRNSVQLIGHLGSDPESYKNAQGEYVTQTTWHRLEGWDKMATRMEQAMFKGREIAIRGKLINQSYDDKNGIKRYVTKIRVMAFELLGKNPNKATAELDVAPEKEGVMPF